MNLRTRLGLIGAAAGIMFASFAGTTPTPREEFTALRDNYVSKVKPLEYEAKLAWWESATVGSDESYARREKADNELAKIHQDKETFKKLKRLRRLSQKSRGASAKNLDDSMKRELELMYNEFVPYQADPKVTEQIIALEAEVDKIFNTHRSTVGGKKLTENEVRQVLTSTKNAKEAKEAWEGYMAVGRKVAPPLKKLVKLRNQMARELGYRDYFAMQLELQEFTEAEVDKIFADLDTLTMPAFKELKERIDKHMASRFSAEGKIYPWMLGDLFFQEAPELTSFSADSIYKDKDPVKLAENYYLSMGLDPKAIIARSDLYERDRKSPHAFEECFDREQDIRVLCNVKPNAAWMDTVCHELGHGIYDQYISPELPYLLRTPSHILTTEGYAMLEGEMTRTKDFLEKVCGLKGEELDKASSASWDILRSERLIFCRWTLTMYNFEKEMYKNPDQDLNKLWWSLKARYQLQDPPEDMSGQDYGAKMHIVGAPVYYHCYMLGDLFACQLFTHISKNVLHEKNPLDTSLYGKKEAGTFLKDRFFAYGSRYSWNELTERITGKPLGAQAFADLYVK